MRASVNLRGLSNTYRASGAMLGRLRRAITAPSELAWDGSLLPLPVGDTIPNRAQWENAVRRRTVAIYLGDNRTLCRVLGRYKVYVDPRDEEVSPHLLLDGYWETWITLFLMRNLREGMTVIDIGANVGYYTLLSADMVGPSGRVISFEPNDSIFSFLRSTIEVNGFSDRVDCRDQAVWGTSDEVLDLVVRREHLGAAHLVETTGPRNADERRCRVKTVTLDSLCCSGGGRNIDLIKIDAEGAEEAIWRGSQELLAKCPGVRILMEFAAARHSRPSDFLDRICAAGFPLRFVDTDAQDKAIAKETILRRPNDVWMLWLVRQLGS
jgi:FkbM family methyltransferase